MKGSKIKVYFSSWIQQRLLEIAKGGFNSRFL
jgi:hypothetical protein